MTARSLIARVFAPLVARATEGAFRPGPYQLPLSGGWLPDGAPLNWWQTGMDPLGYGQRSAMVEACVSAYSQTVAMLPGSHWRSTDNGGRERVTSSALSRILRRGANEYSNISDFLLNLVRSLYLEGNAYALCLRNDRFEISELHLMDSRVSAPQLAENGEVFYHLAGNPVIERRLQLQSKATKLVVPQRDVLHIRLHVDRRYPFPLRGESPLIAAMSEIAAADAMKSQQLTFWMNQARPSAVLSTDLVLKREQVDELRQMWNEQARGLDGSSPGGVPILTAGLKVQPWSMPAKDAQVAEISQMNIEQIALAFRIPLQVLGLGDNSYNSTEALYQSWIASGLGFCLNHVEEAIGLTFGLDGQPDEYVEFDTAALLRSQFKDRIEALSKGVLGGIFAPNEARELESLKSVKAGDEPRVQQQVVPLSAAEAIPVKPPSTGPHPPPAPGPAAPPAAAGQPAPKLPKDQKAYVERSVERVLRRADRYDRAAL